MLPREIPVLLPVNPQGGKIGRAQAISPLVEAGNVYLPHPDYAPWVNDFIEECAQFPNGAHDDQVDAMTKGAAALAHAAANARVRYRAAPTRRILMRVASGKGALPREHFRACALLFTTKAQRHLFEYDRRPAVPLQRP